VIGKWPKGQLLGLMNDEDATSGSMKRLHRGYLHGEWFIEEKVCGSEATDSGIDEENEDPEGCRHLFTLLHAM
jgi:hypothetical protein